MPLRRVQTHHSQPTAYDSHAPQPTVTPSRGLRATGGQHAAAHTTAHSGADAHGSRGLALGGGSRADRRRAAAAHARTRASGRTPVRLCLLRHRLHTPAPAAPVLPAVLAHRTLIFGTSATSRVDSARAHFCSHFFARASPSKRFPAPQAPSCQPRTAEEIFEQRSGGPFCVRKCGLAAHLGGYPCRWPGWKTTPGRALTTCRECATCERLAAP